MIAAKNSTPKKSRTPCFQLRMIHETFSVTASTTRQTPSTTKNAMVFRRLEIRIVSHRDCTAERRSLIQEICECEKGMNGRTAEGRYAGVAQFFGFEELRRNEIALRRRHRGRDGHILRPLLLGYFGPANLARQPQFIHDPNSVPIEVNFIPRQSM